MSQQTGSIDSATPSGLVVEWDERPESLVVRLIGSVGVAQTRQLESQLTRVSAYRKPLVVVDLSRMDFICSLGIGMLMSLKRSVGMHKGVVRVASPQAPVEELLRGMRLTDVIAVRPSVEAALAG